MRHTNDHGRGNEATEENVVDLYDYIAKPVSRHSGGRRRIADDWRPQIVDDFPNRIPITEAELDIIEVHFKELLDELFGPTI